MEELNNYWGVNDNISITEISARAIAIFFISLLLIRFSGMRPFGKGNSYDVIIVFLIGGILSRGVVGATPFLSTVAGAFSIIIAHKVLGKICFNSEKLDHIVNGKKNVLYSAGHFYFENMKRLDITESDIYEELRLQLQMDSLQNVRETFLEKTGEISFVLKK